MAKDFVAGSTVEQLVGEYGVGDRRVRQILKAKGLRASDRKRTYLFENHNSPRSQLHLRIGEKVYHAYFIERDLSRTEAAEELGVSAKALRSIEIGRYNLTLIDLQILAAFLSTTVGELLDEN